MPNPDMFQTIQSKVFAAVEADESGDTARALQLMQQAHLLLSVLPDGVNEDAEVSFDRESISRAIVDLKRKIGAQRGVISESVRIVRG